ncbi:MAG: hypothetical protein C5B54_08695, partial [Acidobacteria bacterium]
LSCNMARYYNPQIGRFVSEDPLRFSAGPSFYGYGRNMPSMFVDPLGLFEMILNFDIVDLNSPQQVRGHCDRPSEHAFSDVGCTHSGALVDWYCDCQGGSTFRLHLTLEALIRVYHDPRNPYYDDPWLWRKVVTGAPGSDVQLLAHENEHVVHTMDVAESLRARGLAAEAIPYPSKDACNAAGKRYEQFVGTYLTNFKQNEPD